jgi:hypothetical protein
MNDIIPFSIGITKYFSTNDTPIIENAKKMCYVDAGGNPIKNNGRYICRLPKGNVSISSSARYLNIYPEDITDGYISRTAADAPKSPVITLRMFYRDNPWSAGLKLNDYPTPPGYLTSADLLNAFDVELAKRDYTNVYEVYNVSTSPGTDNIASFSVYKVGEMTRGVISNPINNGKTTYLTFALRKNDPNKNVICKATSPYYRESVNIGTTSCGSGWSSSLIF